MAALTPLPSPGRRPGRAPRRTPRAVTRDAGRRARFVQAMAAADTPLQKLAAAGDLLRAVLADPDVPPHEVDRATSITVDHLVKTADELTRKRTQRRNR